MCLQEAKKRAKEKAEAQKQVEAILEAASGGGGVDGAAAGGGGGTNGGGEGEVVDSAKRAKALSKKIKKLEGVKTKRDAGEAINAVSRVAGLLYVVLRCAVCHVFTKILACIAAVAVVPYLPSRQLYHERSGSAVSAWEGEGWESRPAREGWLLLYCM